MVIQGKFDWISDAKASRNIIIGMGWLCLTAGVVYSTMINVDWKNPNTATGLGLIMVFYGAIWIPLLMLVPYVLLLNPEWQNTLSPNFYKMPLVLGCFIGLAFHFLSNNQLGNLFRDEKAS